MSTDAPSQTKTRGSRQTPGWLYRLKFAGQPTASYALDYVPDAPPLSPVAPPYVDSGKMCATATISTATPDRVGDVLLPRGCEFEDYAKNPVVLWSHGLEQGLTLPIGMSKDNEGRLTLEITDNEVKATSYFSQTSEVAAQIFSLICDGIVVATSVRETPVSQRKAWRDGQEISIVDRWLMEEWSWCAIGVNPDAVAKALNGRYDGRRLAPSICKSLNAVMPSKKPFGKGFEDSTMKTENDDKDGEDSEVTQTDAALETPADESNKATRDEDGSATDSDSPDVQGDPAEDMKLGCQGMRNAHEGLKSLRGSVRNVMKSMDECPAKQSLGKLHDDLAPLKDQVEADHESHYPNATQLKSEDESEDGGEDASADDEGGDSEMKSMIARGGDAEKNALLAKARMKSLRHEKGLSPTGRKSLEAAISYFTQLIDGAQTVKKSRRPKEDPRIAAALGKLKAITASAS